MLKNRQSRCWKNRAIPIFPPNNSLAVCNQFTVKGRDAVKRPDVVVFINGLPVAVVELKNLADENATVRKAFDLPAWRASPGMPDTRAFRLQSPPSNRRRPPPDRPVTPFSFPCPNRRSITPPSAN